LASAKEAGASADWYWTESQITEPTYSGVSSVVVSEYQASTGTLCVAYWTTYEDEEEQYWVLRVKYGSTYLTAMAEDSIPKLHHQATTPSVSISSNTIYI